MKNLKLLLGFAILFSFAKVSTSQVYVNSSGNVSAGSTSSTNGSTTIFQSYGSALFSSASSGSTSAAYIYVNPTAAYSSATNPDYTWLGDVQTGFFHPASDVLGFTTGGTERIRVASTGYVGIGTTSPSDLLHLYSTSSNLGLIVDGTTAPAIKMANSGTTKVTFGLSTATADYSTDALTNDMIIRVEGTSQHLLFNTNGGTGASTMCLYNGLVGIGTASPSSVLSVGGAGNSSYEAYILNPSGGYYKMGLVVDATVPATSSDPTFAILGRDSAGTGGYAYGVYGQAYNYHSYGSGRNYGTYGNAANATGGFNYGVYGMISGSANGAGVFGTTSGNGDYNVPGQYAGFFNGNIRMTTDNATKTTTNTWAVSSDKRLKKNITSFKDGLNVLRQIHPITYQFTGAGGLPTQDTNIGVLAQDVQKVAPYCIGRHPLIMQQSQATAFSPSEILSTFTDTNGNVMVRVNAYTMNTHGLFYVMVNSIKQLDSTVKAQQQVTNEQQQSIDSLHNTLNNLQQCISMLCAQNGTPGGHRKTSPNDSSSSNTENAPVGSVNSAMLYQNTPNPFTQNTTISCFVPEQSNAASLMVFDMNGGLKRTIPINGNGSQSIVISGQSLTAGMYFYTLIIDGKEIDTKRMILTQ